MPASWWVSSHLVYSERWELDHFSHTRINISALLHSYIIYLQYGQAGRSLQMLLFSYSSSCLLRRTHTRMEFISYYFILDWTANLVLRSFLFSFRCLMFRGRSHIRTWPTGIRSWESTDLRFPAVWLPTKLMVCLKHWTHTISSYSVLIILFHLF